MWKNTHGPDLHLFLIQVKDIEGETVALIVKKSYHNPEELIGIENKLHVECEYITLIWWTWTLRQYSKFILLFEIRCNLFSLGSQIFSFHDANIIGVFFFILVVKKMKATEKLLVVSAALLVSLNNFEDSKRLCCWLYFFSEDFLAKYYLL